MRAPDVVEVLDRLRDAGVPHSVAGGWGIDALLGSETLSHREIDLPIAASDLERAELALAEIGFFPDETRESELPAFQMLHDTRGGRVDLHLLVFDETGTHDRPSPIGARSTSRHWPNASGSRLPPEPERNG